MSAGHTPGPWEFEGNSLVGPKIDDKPIWLRPVILRSEVGVNQCNAQLIASAPDLLAERDRLKAANAELAEALGDLERLSGMPSMRGDPVRVAARAVLAKHQKETA